LTLYFGKKVAREFAKKWFFCFVYVVVIVRFKRHIAYIDKQ